MPRFKDRAIVIRCQDWSETSQITVLLTQRHGLIHGLSKGSKRTSPGSVARYSGGFELLTSGEVVGIIKSTSDLATITEWDLQQTYRHLRLNLRAQHIALYAAELTRGMLGDHDPHPRIYSLLDECLTGLADHLMHDWVLLDYQWRLLEDCGYRPRVEVDIGGDGSADGSIPDTGYVFDARAGEVTRDTGHRNNRPGGNRGTRWGVRRSTIELLSWLGRGNFRGDIPGVGSSIEIETVRRANHLLARYVSVILERELNTYPTVFADTPNLDTR